MKKDSIIKKAKEKNKKLRKKFGCFCDNFDNFMAICPCCGGYDGHIFHKYEINTNKLI